MCDLACLVAAIETHLEAHPQAADSAEGVARWWLGGASRSTESVERALTALVHDGRVRCVTLADGTSLYCSASSGGGRAAHWS